MNQSKFVAKSVELASQLQRIVNLGTGYETLGISKAGTIQSQLDVEPTVTLHNLLFLVRKLISNKLVEAFDWLSCFVQGQGQKSEQKHETKKLVELHNHSTSINYVQRLL